MVGGKNVSSRSEGARLDDVKKQTVVRGWYPVRDVQLTYSREQGRFDDTQEEPNGEKTLIAAYASRSCRDAGPNEGATREIEAGANKADNHIRGDLSQNVAATRSRSPLSIDSLWDQGQGQGQVDKTNPIKRMETAVPYWEPSRPRSSSSVLMRAWLCDKNKLVD